MTKARAGSPGSPLTPWLLRRVNQRYASEVAARLRDEGLGGLHRSAYWLLTALSSGATDAGQLVEAMGVTKQAVSKLVDGLVAEGFVLREPNLSDRRRADLALTPKGVRTVEVIRSAVRAAEHTLVAEVGGAAWETTVTTLATLAGKEA
jgi:DNA-binding MarR family transcriptional regulator